MAEHERPGKILTKTEKMKRLQSAKNEDVEFSAEAADHEDIEALRRSEAADRRQGRELND
ncbi:YfhD family protein [Paenibacillus sp. FSL R5-0766]|uniref:YfhD family protein n=1 Tax=Paenibacillus TaxID=44249 RepID=UPI00096C73F5|nr:MULTISPECIES: YfhD family protein [Paenibacillus]MCF7752916.1 YfhD family protein [Paenibacillus xylanexedens]OMF64692.1 YfhD family protein [Paenibacillus sp. FSL R5-0765]